MPSEAPEQEPLRIPRHVAIIMDGNGRWAEARGRPRVDGHEVGAESVREVVRACRELGVEALTLYSFSTENWSRPTEEIEALMSLLARYLVGERAEILDNGIRFRAIGQLERLPNAVNQLLEELSQESDRPGTCMTLCLALSYGGRAEIVGTAQALAQKAIDGEITPEAIDEDLFSQHLHTRGLPEPELLIRTSGELRISNFLLWQLAYAEIYVTETCWPDFRKPQLLEAFQAFSARERRFGKTGQQLEMSR